MWAICADFMDTPDVPLIIFEQKEEAETYLQKAFALSKELGVYSERGGTFYFDSLDDDQIELMKMFFLEGGYTGCGAPSGFKIKEVFLGKPLIESFSFD